VQLFFPGEGSPEAYRDLGGLQSATVLAADRRVHGGGRRLRPNERPDRIEDNRGDGDSRRRLNGHVAPRVSPRPVGKRGRGEGRPLQNLPPLSPEGRGAFGIESQTFGSQPF